MWLGPPHGGQPTQDAERAGRSILTEQSALKVLYLVATERRPNRSNPTGQINGWKTILNALTIHYGDRIEAAH